MYCLYTLRRHRANRGTAPHLAVNILCVPSHYFPLAPVFPVCFLCLLGINYPPSARRPAVKLCTLYVTNPDERQASADERSILPEAPYTVCRSVQADRDHGTAPHFSLCSLCDSVLHSPLGPAFTLCSLSVLCLNYPPREPPNLCHCVCHCPQDRGTAGPTPHPNVLTPVQFERDSPLAPVLSLYYLSVSCLKYPPRDHRPGSVRVHTCGRG